MKTVIDTSALKSSQTQSLRKSISADIVGPLIHYYVYRLHNYLIYFSGKGAVSLFCMRAGKRIKQIYDLYCEENRLTKPLDTQLFSISRLCVCKSVQRKIPEDVNRVLTAEYPSQPIHRLLEGIFRSNPEFLSKLNLDRENHKAHTEVFSGWLLGDTPEAEVTRTYFTEAEKSFDDYLATVIKGHENAILVDTGWQGTTQLLLSKAYPNINWFGLYFGKSFLPNSDRTIADKAIGLVFEADQFEPNRPETSIVAYRHFIETLFEPNGVSIEEPFGGILKDIAKKQYDTNINELYDEDSDYFFLSAMKYIKENSCIAGHEIISRFQKTLPTLSRLITMPTREEALALSCKGRSADFGKDLIVPVLHLSPKDNNSPEERISKSLWRQGQIAIEHTGKIREELQLRELGFSNSSTYFDLHAEKDAQTIQRPGSHSTDQNVVAIITRTKNRPVLLKRAAQSVANQTFQDFVWVVVNDGGDEDSVLEVIGSSAVDRRKIILVSNNLSVGMEAASNLGIASSKSDLVVIHDDDDSWDPSFLSKTVDFLSSSSGRRYGGVITHSMYISEEIIGQSVVEHGRWPYQDWVRNIQLTEMAAGNFFPPIAFLFRREEWEKIGGYNERLPVLGDWYFNFEFLLNSDIAVMAEPLAYYHHRDVGGAGAYQNSVIGGRSKHEEFYAVARNSLLRKHKDNPLVTAIIQGHALNEIRNVTSRLSKRTSPDNPKPSSNHEEFDKLWCSFQVNRYIEINELKNTIPFLDEYEDDLEKIASIIVRLRINLNIPKNFDEAGYLDNNPDVKQELRSDRISSGYQHFIVNGFKEGRYRNSKS